MYLQRLQQPLPHSLLILHKNTLMLRATLQYLTALLQLLSKSLEHAGRKQVSWGSMVGALVRHSGTIASTSNSTWK